MCTSKSIKGRGGAGRSDEAGYAATQPVQERRQEDVEQRAYEPLLAPAWMAGSAASCNLELQLAYHRLQDASLLCWLIGESTTHCRSFAVELKAHESPTVLRDRGTDR